QHGVGLLDHAHRPPASAARQGGGPGRALDRRRAAHRRARAARGGARARPLAERVGRARRAAAATRDPLERRPGHLALARAHRPRGRHRRRDRPALAQRHHDRAAERRDAEAARRRADPRDPRNRGRPRWGSRTAARGTLMRRPASTPPELPGHTFVRLLGSGGFSDVFLYEQQLPRRRVAVKVLLLDELTPANRAAFVAEANLMAQLSAHPYIVTIY